MSTSGLESGVLKQGNILNLQHSGLRGPTLDIPAIEDREKVNRKGSVRRRVRNQNSIPNGNR